MSNCEVKKSVLTGQMAIHRPVKSSFWPVKNLNNAKMSQKSTTNRKASFVIKSTKIFKGRPNIQKGENVSTQSHATIMVDLLSPRLPTVKWKMSFTAIKMGLVSQILHKNEIFFYSFKISQIFNKKNFWFWMVKACKKESLLWKMKHWMLAKVFFSEPSGKYISAIWFSKIKKLEIFIQF